jgi:hypothetical protein
MIYGGVVSKWYNPQNHKYQTPTWCVLILIEEIAIGQIANILMFAKNVTDLTQK